MKLLWTAGLALVSLLVLFIPRAEASAGNRVTLLYDGFGKPSGLKKDTREQAPWHIEGPFHQLRPIACGTRLLDVGRLHLRSHPAASEPAADARAAPPS